MIMLDPIPISFRPLATDDLPRLHRWLNTPHVAEWWPGRPTLEAVVAKYTPRIAGQEPVHCFVVLYSDTPIGYIQTYNTRDYPDYSSYVDDSAAMAQVDVFIGDVDYVHKGMGSPIVARFLRDVVFGSRHAAACLIDPDTRNIVAIRCYEKAGFRRIRTVQVPEEGKSVHLMRIDKANVVGR